MKILPYKLKNIELLILSLFSIDICFHSYFYSETTYGFVLFFPLGIFNRKYIISCYATNLSSQNRDCLGKIFFKMKTLIWKDTRTPVILAALLTIAKMWKQPVPINIGLDTEDVHTYTLEYSAIKRMKFCCLQQQGWI